MNQTNIQVADQNRTIGLPTDILGKYKEDYTAGKINADQARTSILNDLYTHYGIDPSKYSPGLSQGGSAYNENIQGADQAINFLTTAESGSVGGQAFEAALKNLNFSQTNLAPQVNPTREPAPTVAPLSVAEIAQNQKADAEYQKRLVAQGGSQSPADLLLQQAQQLLNGGTSQTGQPTPQQSQTQPATYQGPSIVDYLNSTGQPSDFNTRAAIAAKAGIPNYSGTASQNTQLLNTLRSANGHPDTSNFSAGAQSSASNSSSGGTGTTTDPATQSIIDKANAIATSLGYTPPNSKDSPQNQITNLYTQALTSLGVPTIQAQLKNVADETANLQLTKAQEIETINNDPWISEGVRVNRIKKLDDKYATREDILLKKQTLYQTAYDKSVSQAQWEVGQISSAMEHDATNNANIFEKALTVAEQQASALASANKSNDTADIKNYEYAKSQGYKGTFNQYQTEQANLHVPAQTTTLAEKKDQAYAGINQLLVPGAAYNGIPFIDSDGYLTVQGFKTLVNEAATDGISRSDFVKQYATYISPYNPKNYGLTAAEIKSLTGE